jgi:uncharacterized protein YjbJ (UPF0337 family)
MFKSKSKSGRRDKAEGAIDRFAGRILQAWGRLTGNRKHRAKGGAARARGGMRSGRGAAKRTVKR